MTQKEMDPQELVAHVLDGIKRAKEDGQERVTFELKDVPRWIILKAIIQSLAGLNLIAFGIMSGGLEEEYHEKIVVDLIRKRPKE